MIPLFSRFALASLLVVASVSPLRAEYVGRSVAELGKVEFSTSCSPAVQDAFIRGVAELHSFWWSEGEATFKQVLVQDPS